MSMSSVSKQNSLTTISRHQSVPDVPRLRLRRPNAMHHAGASVGLTSASTRSAPSLDSKFTCRDFEGFDLHYVNQDFTLASHRP